MAALCRLKQAPWFPLQTAVLQNLLGYLALDSLRRALLVKVRTGAAGTGVAGGVVLGACSCGGGFALL